MKYHHDRLHPREPRPAGRDGQATGRDDLPIFNTEPAEAPRAVRSELLDREGSPQDFEQARCPRPSTARAGSPSDVAAHAD